jgi:hypothetical protein
MDEKQSERREREIQISSTKVAAINTSHHTKTISGMMLAVSNEYVRQRQFMLHFYVTQSTGKR